LHSRVGRLPERKTYQSWPPILHETTVDNTKKNKVKNKVKNSRFEEEEEEEEEETNDDKKN